MLKIKFPTKNHEDAQGLSPPGVELGTPKVDKFEIYKVLKWESRFTFGFKAVKNMDYTYRVIHLKCPTPQNLTNKNS